MMNGNKTRKSFKIAKYSRCHPQDGAAAASSSLSQTNGNNNWVYLERHDMKVLIERANGSNNDDEVGWYMKVSAFIPGELVLEYFELTATRLRQYQISGAQKDLIAGFRYTAENGDMRRFQLKFGTTEDCAACCSVLSTFFPCRVVTPQSPAQLIQSQQQPTPSQHLQPASLLNVKSPPVMDESVFSTAPFILSSQNTPATSNEVSFQPPPTQQYRPSPVPRFGMSPANNTPIPNDLLSFTNGGVASNNSILGIATPSSTQTAKRKADDILYNELTDTIVGATAAAVSSSSLPSMSDETLRKKVTDKLSDANFLQFVSRLERIISHNV
ncbi:hypothetical protein SeLEV6574_g03561 [Synchytrium endobioticum]|nr:hypothetical protein SeLEV6574_g03561 [Synchytrium endobioticum]